MSVSISKPKGSSHDPVDNRRSFEIPSVTIFPGGSSDFVVLDNIYEKTKSEKGSVVTVGRAA